MKSLLFVLIATNFMFYSCEKSGYGPSIRGKLVHRSCASAVVQILDQSQKHLGQESWQMTPTSPVYHDVFVVSNHCSFGKYKIDVGDEFNFQLTKDPDDGCAVCALWDNPPTVQQRIVVVDK